MWRAIAPGLAQLAHAYGLTLNYSRNASKEELHRVVEEFLPKAETAGQRAIQLDPNLADGYLALGRVQSDRGKFLPAAELFSKALALDPNNPDSVTQYSNLLANVGRLKGSSMICPQALPSPLRETSPWSTRRWGVTTKPPILLQDPASDINIPPAMAAAAMALMRKAPASAPVSPQTCHD